jgi:hypothetical protein
MPRRKWEKVFSKSFREKGATKTELLALIASVSAPLAEAEIQAINASQSNPFPKNDPLHALYKPFDPRRWLLPDKPLPASFLEFLKWSNGGSFFNSDRQFDPFFCTTKLREYLVGYHVPQYMPQALPFAFDGGGRFYLFDMRSNSVDGEYPILFVSSGNLSYRDAVLVADSFLEACQGTTNPGGF